MRLEIAPRHPLAPNSALRDFRSDSMSFGQLSLTQRSTVLFLVRGSIQSPDTRTPPRVVFMSKRLYINLNPAVISMDCDMGHGKRPSETGSGVPRRGTIERPLGTHASRIGGYGAVNSECARTLSGWVLS